MNVLDNPLRGHGLPSETGMAEGMPSLDVDAAKALFAQCPVAHETSLTELDALAREIGIDALHAKDERERMGLGSFKALGAAYAIAKDAIAAGGDPATALEGITYVSSSAGNHGLSLVAGARLFGARGVVFLSDTVPEVFAERLRAKGGEVIRAGTNYEESMVAAMAAADENAWRLLSDTSWEGYSQPARDIMEGYLLMGEEAARQMPHAPTHVFLQAGVGGLATAGAVMARQAWGDAVHIVIVEPVAAPALIDSVKAGRPIVTEGPVSEMGRLDCKEPSHLALKYLAREADSFVTVTEEEAASATTRLAQHGMASTPSGAAGAVALFAMAEPGMRALIYVSEEPEDA